MSWFFKKLWRNENENETPEKKVQQTQEEKPAPIRSQTVTPASASAWQLSPAILNGGTLVARAVISLSILEGSMRSQPQLKASEALLVLIRFQPYKYEIRVLSKALAILLTQPVSPKLSFSFKPYIHSVVWSMTIERF